VSCEKQAREKRKRNVKQRCLMVFILLQLNPIFGKNNCRQDMDD
jgi:hypothetical protein